MAIPVPSGATGRAGPARASAQSASRADSGMAGPVGAWTVVLGTVMTTVALSWDVQWHVEVGPDTFFTLPHLFLYSGSAISGLGSLAMVLLATSAQRAGRPMSRKVGGTPVRVFGGTFTAPLGYLVSGIGSALFLLYGLLDLQWHSIYGFDAVLNTPSHVALFLSITITMVGSIIVFSAARDRVWALAGILTAIPITITFAPISAQGLTNLNLSWDPVVAASIFVSTLLLILGAGILRRPGAALAIAAVLGAFQGILWWFSPWAAHAYANSVGLPLRDYLPAAMPPTLPNGIPMFLGVAAVVVEALFWLTRTRGLNVRMLPLLTGTVTGLVISSSIPLQVNLTDPTTHQTTHDVLVTIFMGLPAGLVAGLLCGPFTAMLRAVAPAAKEA
jgi:hypothetical protein